MARSDNFEPGQNGGLYAGEGSNGYSDDFSNEEQVGSQSQQTGHRNGRQHGTVASQDSIPVSSDDDDDEKASGGDTYTTTDACVIDSFAKCVPWCVRKMLLLATVQLIVLQGTQ